MYILKMYVGHEMHDNDSKIERILLCHWDHYFSGLLWSRVFFEEALTMESLKICSVLMRNKVGKQNTRYHMLSVAPLEKNGIINVMQVPLNHIVYCLLCGKKKMWFMSVNMTSWIQWYPHLWMRKNKQVTVFCIM